MCETPRTVLVTVVQLSGCTGREPLLKGQCRQYANACSRVRGVQAPAIRRINIDA